jgi:hypothetical protein
MTGRRRAWLVAGLALVGLVACQGSGGGGGAAAGTPEAAVQNVLDALREERFSDIGPMVCSAKRDQILRQIDIATALASSAPGIDPQEILDAMTMAFDDLQVTRLSEAGDKALVSVKGKLTIAIDEAKARDLVRAMLTATGKTPTDEQVDRFLPILTAQLEKGQPIDSQVEVVREGGAWLVCSNPSLPG